MLFRKTTNDVRGREDSLRKVARAGPRFELINLTDKFDEGKYASYV